MGLLVYQPAVVAHVIVYRGGGTCSLNVSWLKLLSDPVDSDRCKDHIGPLSAAYERRERPSVDVGSCCAWAAEPLASYIAWTPLFCTRWCATMISHGYPHFPPLKIPRGFDEVWSASGEETHEQLVPPAPR